MKIVRVVTIVTTIALWPFVSSAQEIDSVPSGKLIPGTTPAGGVLIRVFNTTDQPQKLHLRPHGGNWQLAIVKPHQASDFRCQTCSDSLEGKLDEGDLLDLEPGLEYIIRKASGAGGLEITQRIRP